MPLSPGRSPGPELFAGHEGTEAPEHHTARPDEALEELGQLERLWIGAYTEIPEEELERLRQVLPDTRIETGGDAGIDGKWRYENGVSIPTARYALLREQFDYARYEQVLAWYWNDPLCPGKGL